MWKIVMLEDSYAECAAPQHEAAPRLGAGWSRRAQAAILLLNALPLLHVTAVIIAATLTPGTVAKITIAIGGIYLVPPLAVRFLTTIHPLRPGSFPLNGADFLRWWATAQAQIIFCRFPFLEEALRILPGIYSAWLRLWGAKIGRLTYWAPGLQILDRSLLDIGDDVIFGAGVRLNPHVISDESGEPLLHLAPVRIGSGCQIGGYSLLTAGTIVEPRESLKAFSLSPPFTTWHNGRRAKIAIPK
jgi:drug/metabolite transporter superfamily protein YnfA